MASASARGCMLCGWSIMLEKPTRRKDMAPFCGAPSPGYLTAEAILAGQGMV